MEQRTGEPLELQGVHLLRHVVVDAGLMPSQMWQPVVVHSNGRVTPA